MCWLASFWVCVLKAFVCLKQEMVVNFGAQNCDLGGLVPPFGTLGGYFGIFGAPWATLGAAGRTRGDPGSDF